MKQQHLFPVRPHTDESLDGGARQARSPLRQGALLLAIYVAMYGTVGLLVHVAHVLADDVAASAAPTPGSESAQRAQRRTPRRVACTPVAEEQRCAHG